jgi:hypothetical protein
LKLGEIQQLIKEDDKLQNISEERRKELIAALLEHRKANKQGLRPSNISASLDVRATLDRIGDEVN